jgi:acyl carrier protein
MDPAHEAVRQFIVDELAGGDGRGPIEPDASLIRSGILDSLGLLRLMVFIEERYGVEVEAAEVIPANFESLDRIGDFIDAKRREAGGEGASR